MISSNITQNKSEVVLWEEVVEEAEAEAAVAVEEVQEVQEAIGTVVIQGQVAGARAVVRPTVEAAEEVTTTVIVVDITVEEVTIVDRYLCRIV